MDHHQTQSSPSGAPAPADTQQQNGLASASVLAQASSSPGTRPRYRAPTVDEALRYSPLTSIVPFTADIIPFPVAAPSSKPRLFADNKWPDVRKDSELLNREIETNGSTSGLLQQSLKKLESLLRAEDLTVFTFPKPPTNLPPASNGTKHKTAPKLTPFAKMVMERSGFSYRYPTPAKTTAQKKSNQRALKDKSNQTPLKDKTNQGVPKEKPTIKSQSSSFQIVIPSPVKSILGKNNEALLVKQYKSPPVEEQTTPGLPKLAPTSVPETSSPIAVMVPGLPCFKSAEYQASTDRDRQILSSLNAQSRKRKRDAEEVPELSVDQRQKAYEALNTLQNIVDSVLHAEDQYAPDQYGEISAESSRFFMPGISSSSGGPVMVKSIQGRLELAVQKTISTKCFSNIPTEHVLRIQKLCEGTTSTIESQTLSVYVGASESDLDEWGQRLEIAENGLCSARTLLRILTAGREERELYSEDLLTTIMRSLEHVTDTLVVPVVESRQSGSDSELFKSYCTKRKELGQLVVCCQKTLKLIGELIAKVDIAEDAINKVEFLALKLIFVENAHHEKDSVLGVQRFEQMRRTAMDTLAKIFAKHPNQRNFIFDEILVSLEKLPVTRQSARQFKLPDGKPIQLVSALLMRLVQTSATWTEADSRTSGRKVASRDDGSSEEDDDEDDALAKPKFIEPIDMDKAADYSVKCAANELRKIAAPLYDSAYKAASHVITFMIQRAVNSTKSGDLPYRNLLDIFTEDFLGVLGSPEWPAAEMLLGIMLSRMLMLMEEDRQVPVPQKGLALDIMATMGSGITDLQMQVRNSTRHTHQEPSSPIAARLSRLAEDYLDDGSLESSFHDPEGPFRAAIEYLVSQGGDDAQTGSARGFLLTLWARANLEPLKYEDEDMAIPVELLLQLRNSIPDHYWLHQEYEFPSVAQPQARLASALIALGSMFCKCQHRILNTLIVSMRSQHSTLKSKSLRSVVHLLEKDPAILDRSNIVIQQIIRCAEDSSPLVRDSALSLLSKCLVLKPSLENQAYIKVVQLSDDENTGVRKRSMKILKDIYLRNDNAEMRSLISNALLRRIKDHDEGVKDLAQSVLEELWVAPFHESSASKDAVQIKMALEKQVALVVRTVRRGDSTMPVLEVLLGNILSKESKSTSANLKVCKSMVAAMFDMIIDNENHPERSQHNIAQTLTVFAKVEPKLFAAQQLGLLEPYVKNLQTQDNLIMYRYVTIILKYILPALSSIEHDFLKDIQNALITATPKLGPLELPETAACLWILQDLLKSPDRLIRLFISVLGQLASKKEKELSEDEKTKMPKYLRIAGSFGNACNFDEYASSFRAKFPNWKGHSTSGFTIDNISPFTRKKYPPSIREAACESIANICLAWPQHYLRSDVTTAFELAFHDDDSKLQAIVLNGFRLFFLQEEQRSESGAAIKVGSGPAHGGQRLASAFIAGDNDGAATTIAQKFLAHILRTALATTDDLALLATQVIASINRQGLVHPKEYGPALVALETSSNATIAAIAFKEHKNLHEKHETMFEKEYMRAIDRAFQYQREIVQDMRGIVPAPPSPPPYAPKFKSLFEVLKVGHTKVRKRFLTNLCAKVDFELPKLEGKKPTNPEDMPRQVLFARFVCENLAFFEYPRLDELMHLVACLEKMVVAGTGAAVAHAIETDILKVSLEETSANTNDNGGENKAGAMNGFAGAGADMLTFSPPSAVPVPSLSHVHSQSPPPLPPFPIQANGTVSLSDLELVHHAPALPPLESPPAQQRQLVPAKPSTPVPALDPVDHVRLRQLTTASMILLLVWETRTHLRALWGLQKNSVGAGGTHGSGAGATGNTKGGGGGAAATWEGKNAKSGAGAGGAGGGGKPAAKDTNKAPTKVPFFTGTPKYLDRIASVIASLADTASMKRCCAQFAELLNVDHELKVSAAGGGEDEGDDWDGAGGRWGDTPSGDEVEIMPIAGGGGGRGRKRKASVGPAGVGTPGRSGKVRRVGTPRKRAAGKRRSASFGSCSAGEDDDGGWD